MKFISIITGLFLFFSPFFASYAQNEPMNNARMEKIIKAEVEEILGESGNWQLIYRGSPLLVITDESNNRMRIFTPIIEEEQVEEGQLKKMLEANFHSALDAKYSLYKGFVISVYTHPLHQLQEDQLIDAMQQVVTLANTFGTSYSSTDLIFGGGPGKERPGVEEDKPKERLNKKPSKNKKS